MRRIVRVPRLLLAALAAAALSVTLLTACAPVRLLTTDQKLADFDYLVATLRDNHPFLFLKARVEGYDWLAHEAEFREEVRRTTNNAEFARAIGRIVRLIGNAHTTVEGEWFVSAVQNMAEPWAGAAARTSGSVAEYWRRLSLPHPTGEPLLLAIYSGGEYYVYKSGIPGIAAGARLVAVDGVPVHEWVPALRGTVALAWDPLRRQIYARHLPLYLGQQARVSAEDVFGWFDTFAVQGRGIQGHRSIYFSLTPYREVVYTRTLGDGQVGYVHIGSMNDDAAYMAALRKSFEQLKDLPALIIDIRGNGGGSDGVFRQHIVAQLAAEPISVPVGVAHRSADLVRSCVRVIYRDQHPRVSASELVARDRLAEANLPPELLTEGFDDIMLYDMKVTPAPDSLRYQGRVYLLVDDVVFSASEMFAAFAKASGWATVVGGFTGGDGIGCSPALVVLPNSKTAVKIPVVLGLNPDWTANEETHTIPHVLIEPDRADLLNWLRRIETGQRHTEPDLVLLR